MQIPTYNLGNYIVPEDCRDGVCVDIGANIGCFFEKYHDFFKLIHFYEPYKPNFDICFSKAINYPNVFGFNEAAFRACGTENIVAHLNNDSGSNAIQSDSINEHWTTKPIGSCQAVDLETILSRAKGYIDYLKCDCETSEWNLFYDKDLSNIKYIGMELHWQMKPKKYNNLLLHILKTHDIIYGDASYVVEQNKELLFKIKS